jgi:hypothetical protein
MAEPKVETVRITDQFRSRNGFVYDFRFEGNRVTLSIAPRENPDDPADWKVEARARHAADPFVIAKWGATRIDALREVGRSWVSEATAHALPTFDWNAIEKALVEVRAL